MDLLLQNRDPLFSLIIFFGLIFIISFFSYTWALWRVRKQKGSLEDFFARFQASADKEIANIIEGGDANRALLLLADAYTKSGDYEKAIAIYLKLKNNYDFKEQKKILEKLGELYYKAGFLARSVEIFEEILRYYPRSPRVLQKLLLVYERLYEYKKALGVCEVLEELGCKSDRDYILAKIAVQKGDEQQLLAIYQKDPKLVRLIFEYLFQTNYIVAWEHLRTNDIPKLFDILWRLPREKISLHDTTLKELYTAKGYVQEVSGSQDFIFDLLIHYPKADLEFSYLCEVCKGVYPFAFTRCPGCHSVGSPTVERIVTQKKRIDEESFSV
ncbi:tetratricopeptide repeat protein [Nitratiruptor tergarcus]|uniref:Tetratricopeptide repeat-containing protein n=1 Tax=Nitratiruptor tergarcus DSM 16512 TaxID=1069081 RepID=A0A1W1WRR2_9BACT|nr:tetratricopeptide repeat protein [Nitratiruptor tergarcus]SMC08895.1 Tetratricopeptide repeat-containing protein [Nitratiruptor tergarcus DSM 16512]